jgi:hypothetical protein
MRAAWDPRLGGGWQWRHDALTGDSVIRIGDDSISIPHAELLPCLHPLGVNDLLQLPGLGRAPGTTWGLVWEMEESSGWKRIEGDFGKFWLIMEIPPPQYPSFPFIPLIPKQALTELRRELDVLCFFIGMRTNLSWSASHGCGYSSV